jgi:hypothetical protein
LAANHSPIELREQLDAMLLANDGKPARERVALIACAP